MGGGLMNIRRVSLLRLSGQRQLAWWCGVRKGCTEAAQGGGGVLGSGTRVFGAWQTAVVRVRQTWLKAVALCGGISHSHSLRIMVSVWRERNWCCATGSRGRRRRGGGEALRECVGCAAVLLIECRLLTGTHTARDGCERCAEIVSDIRGPSHTSEAGARRVGRRDPVMRAISSPQRVFLQSSRAIHPYFLPLPLCIPHVLERAG